MQNSSLFSLLTEFSGLLAHSWPKLLVSWEWNWFRWLKFYSWIVNARYITVEIFTAYYYLYYTIFSKQWRKGRLNVLYFFPAEICTGYQNISYVPWIREIKNIGYLVHKQYGCRIPISLNNVWNECFGITLEASECEIKLDIVISNSCFLLKDKCVDLHRRSFKEKNVILNYASWNSWECEWGLSSVSVERHPKAEDVIWSQCQNLPYGNIFQVLLMRMRLTNNNAYRF